jgi:hypothetical protein
MPYYDTLSEDIARAKEILAKGRTEFHVPGWPRVSGGTIYGADTYAAYRLLESFVEALEHLQSALRVMGPELPEPGPWETVLRQWADRVFEDPPKV